MVPEHKYSYNKDVLKGLSKILTDILLNVPYILHPVLKKVRSGNAILTKLRPLRRRARTAHRAYVTREGTAERGGRRATATPELGFLCMHSLTLPGFICARQRRSTIIIITILFIENRLLDWGMLSETVRFALF